MERQYIKFYIDRKDKLRAIWYNVRKYRMLQSDGYCHSNDFTHDFSFEPMMAVRSVAIKRSCDSHSISKVRYCYTEDEAKATIDARLKRNKEASPKNLTWNHYFQLAKAPMKYSKAFLDFIAETYGEEAREDANRTLFKAINEKELRQRLAKDKSPVVNRWWED